MYTSQVIDEKKKEKKGWKGIHSSSWPHSTPSPNAPLKKIFSWNLLSHSHSLMPSFLSTQCQIVSSCSCSCSSSSSDRQNYLPHAWLIIIQFTHGTIVIVGGVIRSLNHWHLIRKTDRHLPQGQVIFFLEILQVEKRWRDTATDQTTAQMHIGLWTMIGPLEPLREGGTCADNPPPPPYNCHALRRRKVSECLSEEITEGDGKDMMWCWTLNGFRNRTCWSRL